MLLGHSRGHTGICRVVSLSLANSRDLCMWNNNWSLPGTFCWVGPEVSWVFLTSALIRQLQLTQWCLKIIIILTCMKDHKTAMKPFRLTSMCLSFIAQQVGKQYSLSTREIHFWIRGGRKNTNVAYYRPCTPPAMLPTFRLAYARSPHPLRPLLPPNRLVCYQSRSERSGTVNK